MKSTGADTKPCQRPPPIASRALTRHGQFRSGSGKQIVFQGGRRRGGSSRCFSFIAFLQKMGVRGAPTADAPADAERDCRYCRETLFPRYRPRRS